MNNKLKPLWLQRKQIISVSKFLIKKEERKREEMEEGSGMKRWTEKKGK